MGRENHSKYRITHTYIQRIHYKLPFALSNKIELFEHMRSLGLCNAISTCGYISLAKAMYSSACAHL